MSISKREVLFNGRIGDNNVLEGIGPFTIESCDNDEKVAVLKRFLTAVSSGKYNGEFKLLEVKPLVTSYVCLPYRGVFMSPEIKKSIIFEGYFDTCGETISLDDFSDDDIECVNKFFDDIKEHVLVSYNITVRTTHTNK